jgi:hypothetical protein
VAKPVTVQYDEKQFSLSELDGDDYVAQAFAF